MTLNATDKFGGKAGESTLLAFNVNVMQSIIDSCDDVTESGLYEIKLAGGTTIMAYCRFADGRGWMKIGQWLDYHTYADGTVNQALLRKRYVDADKEVAGDADKEIEANDAKWSNEVRGPAHALPPPMVPAVPPAPT